MASRASRWRRGHIWGARDARLLWGEPPRLELDQNNLGGTRGRGEKFFRSPIFHVAYVVQGSGGRGVKPSSLFPLLILESREI